MYDKKKGNPYYTNRHSCFLLQYHMVLVTKYHHPVLTGGVKDVVYQTIRDIFDDKSLVILEMNGEADHIHILYEADPFTSPGELVNIVKTKTSRFARKQYGDTVLKKYYWKPLFWSDSYFVTTVGESTLGIVQKYIKTNKYLPGIQPRPCRPAAPMDMVRSLISIRSITRSSKVFNACKSYLAPGKQ